MVRGVPRGCLFVALSDLSRSHRRSLGAGGARAHEEADVKAGPGPLSELNA